MTSKRFINIAFPIFVVVAMIVIAIVLISLNQPRYKIQVCERSEEKLIVVIYEDQFDEELYFRDLNDCK